MKRHAIKFIIPALVLCLAIVPLVACSGGGAEEPGGESAQTEQTAALDVSSWKTLGDAIAAAGGPTSSSNDEKYYIGIFETDDAVVRVIAESNADVNEKIMDLMPGSEEYAQELTNLIGDLAIISAEDLTSQKMPQDQLDALVGKTGQELLDDGWTFSSYYMYGGDETGATMTNGPFNYDINFDVTVSEEAANNDTEGDSIKTAKVTSVEYQGAADDQIDPTLVDEQK